MMKFEVVKVTPEMAAKLMAKNEGNRKLRQHRVLFLSQAILAGKFALTHQAVAVSTRGRLLDGQHRLRAVMMANKAVDMVIATGVPESAFAVMDAGLPRKMHERLKSDARHTSICTSMFRLMSLRKNMQEYEAELMLEVFDPALVRVDQVTRSPKSKIDKAPHQAAITLRFAQSLREKDEDRVIHMQWMLGMLRRGDMAGAPPIITAFYRQLVEGVANFDIGVAADTDAFCRTWMAFDPEREAASRLQVNDHAGIMKEARAEFAEITANNFAQ